MGSHEAGVTVLAGLGSHLLEKTLVASSLSLLTDRVPVAVGLEVWVLWLSAEASLSS